MKYESSIGYSPLEKINIEKTRNIVKIIHEIICGFSNLDFNSTILVAGAGIGVEAAVINEVFGMDTVGVDINIQRAYLPQDNTHINFQRQDIASLAFLENSFQIIYSFHVLEHVDDPIAAINELFRVMTSGAILFIGFPNKNRLFSYIGTSQNETILNKIVWNLNDYKFRIKRRFENKYGAHAGFTQGEFIKLSGGVFESIVPVRNEYMLKKYSRFLTLVKFAIKTGFAEYIFPSNYFVCIKG